MKRRLKIIFLLVLFVLILTTGCSVIKSTIEASGLEEYFSHRIDLDEDILDDWVFDLLEWPGSHSL